MLALHIDDLKISAHDLSEICRIASFIMLFPLLLTPFSLESLDLLYVAMKFAAFILPACLLYLLYLGLKRVRSIDPPKTKHMMITVSVAWMIIALAGSLPYLINGTLGPLDSFFESISGWTTTGMTLIPIPEDVSMDVLFYRALTQWVGGVGIIVLGLVIFMRKGTFAMDYYASEVGEQRIKPRLKSTVSETWKIYAVYTLACIVLLYVAGMDLFDAVAHAFSALSTGGFSTHTNNIGYYNDMANGFVIQLILLAFMVIGAVSFLIHFRVFEGNYAKIKNNIELRYMFWILLLTTFITFLYIKPLYSDPFKALMDSLFQMVAAMTCTGFGTADISGWHDLPQTLVMLLMYVGGLYGSTAGGIKILRLVLIVQVIKHSLKKLMLPKSAVLRMKIGGKQVDGGEIIYVFALTTAYILISLAGAAILMVSGYSEVQSLSLSLSAMGNVGLTAVPSEMWFNMSAVTKTTLALLMWIGRLEIFPVLVLLTSIVHAGKGRRK